VGDGAIVEHAVVRDSEVGEQAHVGPYAVLEAGSVVESKQVTGAFYTGASDRRAESEQ